MVAELILSALRTGAVMRLYWKVICFFCLLATGALLARNVSPRTVQAGTERTFDLLIRNGHIIDGTGSPWYAGDVAIRDGHIAAIGRLDQVTARQVIDAHGMVVAPGFIDMLDQSGLTILVDPHAQSKIYQGITTEFTGEGHSPAPLSDNFITAHHSEFAQYGIQPTWTDFAGYFNRLQTQGIGVNFGSYVGATQVREVVIGRDDRAPTPVELAAMQALVRTAMRQGAYGLSTSLMYAPAEYATTEEIISLAQAASSYGGLYASHIRDQGTGIMSALDEAIRIGKEAHVPVEIWHLKAQGKASWGQMPAIVDKIQKARADGVDITADAYPYTAWECPLSSFMPPWAADGGTEAMLKRLRDPLERQKIRQAMQTPTNQWDNQWLEVPDAASIEIGMVRDPALVSLRGKTIADAAIAWHEDPLDALLDLLLRDKAETLVVVFGMSQADVDLAVTQPWISICTDEPGVSTEGILSKEYLHPRAYGAFPRVISHYVEQTKSLLLEEAIRKFTALPAQRMGLGDRGVLKVGMWADIVIFDPMRIHDVATYEQPSQLSRGMEYVLVNGVPVIDSGRQTNALPGKVLHGPGYGEP
jgi:N-acyl-D-amino-acid deacylase